MILLQRNQQSSAPIAIAFTHLIWRLPLAALYVVLALGEMLLAPLCGTLAVLCFFVAVLLGFVLSMPIQHKWELLVVSVVLMLAYFLYRRVMQAVLRLIARI